MDPVIPTSSNIATYNRRHNNYSRFQWFGPSDFERFDGNIKTVVPQVLCLQGCSPLIFGRLKRGLASLGPEGNTSIQEIYGEHRDHTPGRIGKRDDDGVGILFNSLRYQLLDTKTLSHTEGNTERSHVWADLFDRTTNKVIRVASVHLFGGNDKSQGDRQIVKIRADLETSLNQAQQRQEAAQIGSAYKIDAIVICGDFNGTHLSTPYNNNEPDLRVTSCMQAGYQYDGSDAVTEVPSQGQQQLLDQKLDYILIKPCASSIASLVPIQTNPLPVGASDHRMVASQLELGAPAVAPTVSTLSTAPTDQTIMARLTALATRIYQLVWDQKIPIGFGLIGAIFGGLVLGVGAAFATFLAQYAIQHFWPQKPDQTATV